MGKFEEYINSIVTGECYNLTSWSQSFLPEEISITRITIHYKKSDIDVLVGALRDFAEHIEKKKKS